MAAGIVIAAIIIISTLQGFRDGGLRTFWSIGCSVAAIILAMTLNPEISDFMTNQVHLDQYIKENVREYLEEQTENDLENAQTEIQNQYIKELEIPSSWKKAIINNNTKDGRGKFLAEGFFEYVASAIAAISVKVFAFVLTFILVAVILKIVSVTFGIIDKIPLLSHVNKLVGIGAGLIRSLIIIWLVMVAIAFVRNYEWGQAVLKLILDNPVAAFFYHHNLVAMAFLSMF